MKDATAAKAKNTAQNTNATRAPASESTALDRRYGKIGISAVAAAVRYQGSAKNPAYAPAPMTWRSRTDEAA
jgi:hypothetical protein